jgi:hypothetical protein
MSTSVMTEKEGSAKPTPLLHAVFDLCTLKRKKGKKR